jgi:hypothetical protein
MNAIPPKEQPKSITKNPLLYFSVLIVLAALYAGYVVFSRWHENRTIERHNTEEKAAHQRESDSRTLEQFGGKDLTIQSFYAGPGIIHRGQSAQICYGVANAKTVTLDPPIGSVWPSNARCLDVSPKQTTTYTLTIADASGNTKSAILQIEVR